MIDGIPCSSRLNINIPEPRGVSQTEPWPGSRRGKTSNQFERSLAQHGEIHGLDFRDGVVAVLEAWPPSVDEGYHVRKQRKRIVKRSNLADTVSDSQCCQGQVKLADLTPPSDLRPRLITATKFRWGQRGVQRISLMSDIIHTSRSNSAKVRPSVNFARQGQDVASLRRGRIPCCQLFPLSLSTPTPYGDSFGSPGDLFRI
jgi:hypothetical protein